MGPKWRSLDERNGLGQDEGYVGEQLRDMASLMGATWGSAIAQGGAEIIPWGEIQRRAPSPMKRCCCPNLTTHNLGTSHLYVDLSWVWTLHLPELCLCIDGLKTFLSGRKGKK